MQSLYKDGLEHIYDAMYQTFIDYKNEFEFYSTILKQHDKNNVLEVGCGTGNLATHFINSDILYTGMDLSDDMVKLSKAKNPNGRFIQGDVTNFTCSKSVQSLIITGRTSSYLLDNKAVYNALNSIYNALDTNGLLCFDFIDASRFFKIIKGGKKVTHKASFNDKHYYRDSEMTPNKQRDNFMFNWDAKYYEITDSETITIAEDKSLVRAFTKNEWELFLELCNFELVDFIDRKSYAFDTYVVVAKKC